MALIILNLIAYLAPQQKSFQSSFINHIKQHKTSFLLKPWETGQHYTDIIQVGIFPSRVGRSDCQLVDKCRFRLEHQRTPLCYTILWVLTNIFLFFYLPSASSCIHIQLWASNMLQITEHQWKYFRSESKCLLTPYISIKTDWMHLLDFSNKHCLYMNKIRKGNCWMMFESLTSSMCFALEIYFELLTLVGFVFNTCFNQFGLFPQNSHGLFFYSYLGLAMWLLISPGTREKKKKEISLCSVVHAAQPWPLWEKLLVEFLLDWRRVMWGIWRQKSLPGENVQVEPENLSRQESVEELTFYWCMVRIHDYQEMWKKNISAYIKQQIWKGPILCKGLIYLYIEGAEPDLSWGGSLEVGVGGGVKAFSEHPSSLYDPVVQGSVTI